MVRRERPIKKDWAKTRGSIEGRFDKDRAITQDEWNRREQQMRDRWNPIFNQEMGELQGIRGQRKDLLSDLRQAPSVAQQQAKENYDRQLQQNSMLASMMGRGISGQGQQIRNQLANQQANVMRDTTTARMQSILVGSTLKILCLVD